MGGYCSREEEETPKKQEKSLKPLLNQAANIFFDQSRAVECMQTRLQIPKENVRNFQQILRIVTPNCNIYSIRCLTGARLLESIDVSCNRLRNFRGLEQCAQLKEVKASRNRIVTIQQLKHCTNLEYIEIQFNELHSSQEFQVLIQLQKLKDLYFQRQKFSDEFEALEDIDDTISSCGSKTLEHIMGYNDFFIFDQEGMKEKIKQRGEPTSTQQQLRSKAYQLKELRKDYYEVKKKVEEKKVLLAKLQAEIYRNNKSTEQ